MCTFAALAIATLDELKSALKRSVVATAPSETQKLSDSQYDAGFDSLVRASEQTPYQDFIIPQLSLLVASLSDLRIGISVLEIGPGPKSVLGSLPSYLRQKVKRYVAFEPNNLFATRLEKWFRSTSGTGSVLSCLESPPHIHRMPFDLDRATIASILGDTTEKFDLILFCHSMYGLNPKRSFIEHALEMLPKLPEHGMVVVFHRNGTLHFDGLICHRTASFPTGVVPIMDSNEILDCFTPFITGCTMQDVNTDTAVKAEWRKVCRTLGRREEAFPDQLLFSSPEIMGAFTQHATMLPELTAQVPVVLGDTGVKNREARFCDPAAVIRPTDIQHIQQCVRWALKHKVSLTVVGGGHSGHCLWPNVVAVDMAAFNHVHIHTGEREAGISNFNFGALIVAGAGCKTGEIVRKSMEAGFTLPLGSRPSVGAGLWLQGGIGHLARPWGLTCDAIVGAVVVSVVSGQILCVGNVPSQHRPADAMHPENEVDLLWAMRGAGTNFGIVVSVTFKAYAALVFTISKRVVAPIDNLDAQVRLSNLDESIARKLPPHYSSDLYLFWDSGKLNIGVTVFEASMATSIFNTPMPKPTSVATILGWKGSSKTVDSVGLFDAEMYMSEMHGGHSAGKTSSFKRCIFLKQIGAVNIASLLVAAVETRPLPLCYLHLLQGGGAVSDMAKDATAFGCRDWDFACVITGVWPRDQDGTESARAAVQWVYNVAADLLPLSSGAYGADLGPDPRDAALATKAFGPNLHRLACLKRSLDPSDVLAYACPLPKLPAKQKLIILVTGKSRAGKDYCAGIWVSAFNTYGHKSLTARAVSISDTTKQKYAAATGADSERLLHDRAYKEQHRPALLTYYQDQVRSRPQLPEEHFLNVVRGAADVDVLLITGMRDEAPVVAFSHLVPDSRVLEVHVVASKEMRTARGDHSGGEDDVDDNKDENGKDSSNRPDFIFDNDTSGNEAAARFCEDYLIPFVHKDLQRLADMVRLVPNFPSPGIEFHDVLGISQQSGGLALCTCLLQSHFTGDWSTVDAVACCESGSFVYASALALRVDVPLALIREAGKIPPPTISVTKPASHVSSSGFSNAREKTVEIGRDVVPRGGSVVVLDDVLATGETLCAVLQLLQEAGVAAEDVTVMVVAEFPVHRGRQLVRQRGFGGAKIQNLLAFGGA